MKIRRKIVAWLCLGTVAITGCGGIAPDRNDLSVAEEAKSEHGEKETPPVSLGFSQEFTYQVLPMKTSVKVNQIGYEPSREKIAVFENAAVDAEFEVIEYKTGETVYTGRIKGSQQSEEDDISFSYGDFTSFNQEGTFCIRTEGIGYSYPFVIREKLYDGLFQDALKQFYFSRCGTSLPEEYAGESARNACHTSLAKLQEDMKSEKDVTGGWHTDEKGNRSVLMGCNTMQTLLLAYEIHPEVFGDDTLIPEREDQIPDLLNELQYEAQWLLKMQDETTGGVYDGVRTTDYGNGNMYSYIQPVSVATSLRYAAAMAKFSYVYQNYDNQFATMCLRAADRAIRYAKHYPEELDEGLLFQAAVELYRATGQISYRNVVDAYLISHTSFDMEDDAVFQACTTYLLCKQRVNISYCDMMITNLMKYVERLSTQSRDLTYLAADHTSEKGTVFDMLRSAQRMVVVNYVITNSEYDKLLLNYTHYFLGCNEEALCYVGQYGTHNAMDVGKDAGIMNQAETDALWIMLLSDIQ